MNRFSLTVDTSIFPAQRVSELLGWQMGRDGKTVVLGFRQPSGAMLNVAMEQEVLVGVVLGLLGAWAGFQAADGGEAQLAVGKASRIEVERVRDGPSYVLTAWFAGGGRFSFEIPDDAGPSLKRLLDDGVRASEAQDDGSKAH